MADAARGRAASGDAKAALEEHQRQVARWEGRVARQLEKIVALQRGGGRTPSLTPSPAAFRPSAPSGFTPLYASVITAGTCNENGWP